MIGYEQRIEKAKGRGVKNTCAAFEVLDEAEETY